MASSSETSTGNFFTARTTSAGQSADVTILNAVLEEAGIKYDYCDVPTAEMLAAGVGMAALG